MAGVTRVSFARRLSDLADADPDRPSVSCGETPLTRRELDERATALALDLRERGVGVGDMVTIALPNSVDWFVAAAAAWKLGATPQPVGAHLPGPELAAIVELADPAVVIGVPPEVVGDRVCLPAGYRPPEPPAGAEPLPDAVAPAWKAPTSGGSTGRPKLIVAGEPSELETDGPVPLRVTADGCLVMPGPLYHNGPVVWSCQALLWGSHVVLLPRFDAEATLAAIEAHGADTVYLVPTMMRRIWRLPAEVRDRYDLSSLRTVWHLAEPCPPWLKEEWIRWLGPERIIELYAGTEAQVATVITGADWLTHRGSVGRPVSGQIMICDADGDQVPAGEVGEVWMRSGRDRATYRYVGAEARRREGGWESLGDMGHVDAEGYLYLDDRMADMILSGGANVYPAEVEAVLAEHPAVRSCCVIGLPDEDRGNRVHAIVEADPDAVSEADLIAFVAERLARYKVPRTVELVDEALRDDAGKMRRSELRRQRLAALEESGA
ncbi:MAG TPA: AMP-binding protein [Acidimicrobiales bacterium]|nr:AMP-binding protein [Acidimicrobiales bacterium]